MFFFCCIEKQILIKNLVTHIQKKKVNRRIHVREIEEILRYFPNPIYSLLKNTFMQNRDLQKNLQEIRIRTEKSMILKTRQADIIIDYQISTSEIIQILEKLCENSIYAYKNQICEGFLTVRGGHRIGMVGTAVIEQRKSN